MSEKFSRLALIRFQRMLLFELLHVALLSLQLAGGGVFVNIYPEEKKTFCWLYQYENVSVNAKNIFIDIL